MKHILPILILALLSWPCDGGRARSPSAAGEHIAWGETSFADPTLWKGTDNRYYALATPGGHPAGARYLTSDDALTWTRMATGPFDAATAAAIKRDWKNVWAPDCAVVKGKRLLYVTLYNSAEDSAVGVFTLDGDAGQARDLRILTRSKETGISDTIDPEVVNDPQTKRTWLFFGSVGMMHRIELTADGLAVKPGAQYVHVAGRTDREGPKRDGVFEGAYLHRHGGWWYLFVGAGGYADATYNLRVGRSRKLDGVFTDREGRPMTEGFSTPVLGTEGDFYGPGHNGDVLVGKDGVARIYYHCHWKGTDRDGQSPRIMLCRRLVWGKDGWPTTVKGK